MSQLPIHDDTVNFSTSVEFVSLIYSIKYICLDILNLKLAAHKDAVLNTAKKL